VNKHLKYNNNNDEFFYNSSFDDYEKIYILKYSDIYNLNYTYTKNIKFSNDILITHVEPENFQLSLYDIIGIFYPTKDDIGIYGTFKYIKNNFLAQETFFKNLEYADINPLGIATIENLVMTDFHLYGIYLKI
jgi:hypothetical protein